MKASHIVKLKFDKNLHHILVHIVSILILILQILEMFFESFSYDLGHILVNFKLTCVDVVHGVNKSCYFYQWF